MLKKISTIILASVFLQGCFEEEKLPRVETTNFGYEIVHLADKDKQVFSTINTDKIVVEYYFAWGCPHCNAFHPHLDKWIQTDENFKKVEFGRTPVSLLPNWLDASRLYYVAKDKGFFEAIDTPIFKAFHNKKEPLNEWIEDIAKFALPYAQQVDKTLTLDGLIDLMESDEVGSQILVDNQKVINLMLRTTPSIVVHFNGEIYRINNSSASASGGIISTLNSLINKLNN